VVLKGSGIIGARCFVASGSYLRGGAYLAEDCIIGPNSELKSSVMFAGSKIAHLNFVGDSIVGSGVNIEAGAIIANYRNELADKRIRILSDGVIIDTGVDKFGALVGDHVRIGANSVIAPGAVILPETKIGRLQLIDQYPH
jgi:bifunctional N-acetylglucosamine-1-phosphate-uridyltransferase/glucosamine-1-phosphate-acetyltransferase GlmU-like protein